MSKTFQFRQFLLQQEWSAQRMSTDSMLLGASAEMEGAMNILDIGTGTGVLALMMAQKHPEALVDAVESDEESAREAALNFDNSPWAFRLTSYHQRIQDFASDNSLLYDLIVSNPPYFAPIEVSKGGNTQWPEERRKNARTTETLDFSELLEIVQRLLVKQGRFYLVIPESIRFQVVTLAQEFHLFPFFCLTIRHKANTPAHRVILGFSKIAQEKYHEKELTIYNETGTWTEAYQLLTDTFHQG